MQSGLLTLLVAAICLAATSFSGLAATAPAREMEDVKASGILRVIVYAKNRPFSWVDDASGSIKGIDADIGRALAKQLGLKPQIIPRIAGESADDDIRSNIWQGPRTGGVTGDVMLNIPIDREFIGRNPMAAISNPYFNEEIVVAVHPDMVGGQGLDAFKTKKIAVKFSSAGHYFLNFTQDGAFKPNVAPYLDYDEAIALFLDRKAAGLMGRRSLIEAAVNARGLKVDWIEPEFPSSLIRSWNLGTAVHSEGRDVGYAVGRALRKLRSSGALEAIFASYGVTYVPPARTKR